MVCVQVWEVCLSAGGRPYSGVGLHVCLCLFWHSCLLLLCACMEWGLVIFSACVVRIFV